MFDKARLQEALTSYKQNFLPNWWGNEKFKWEAVKWFQDNWDINAPDFADMLSRSLAKTDSLLKSGTEYPAKMIISFAESAPEEVRAMFVALYDNNHDVIERMNSFKVSAAQLLKKHGNGAKQHYQNEHAISTYLWLKYPDDFCIYKYSAAKTIAEFFGTSFVFKRGAYADDLRNFVTLYGELLNEIEQDSELIDMLNNNLTDECYFDPKHRTLVSDFGFYIYKKYAMIFAVKNGWFPADYSPNITTEQWSELIADPEVFNTSSLEIMKRFLDNDGQATCSQLAQKYGETTNFYNNGATALARRVAEKTVCPLMPRDEMNSRYWPILFLGHKAKKGEDGVYIWKLRDELAEALENADLSQITLYATSAADIDENKYGKEDFLSEVFMSEERYTILVEVLKNKKNLILKGAPGVGKTFAAKRLAYSVMGKVDDERIEFVQFHQNYSYEDFMMGYKPVNDGFELKPGIFYKFCQKAAARPDEEFFFIIDEINRGNMSKVFGELMMLIERDYRGKEITLAYNGEPFSVPENLYIIGMMNTADRSLAMIDYALRRRFSFFDMEPGFDSIGFTKYRNGFNNETFDALVEQIKLLNAEITADKSLGKGFCIGHSYFCGQTECTAEWLYAVVNYDIIPMLEEYWFDDDAKLQRWETNLRGIFQ